MAFLYRDTVDPDQLITCPYEISHSIMARRMSDHIVKCRKNYRGPKTFTCEFNNSHIYPLPEKQYHHENCPDRRELEKLFMVPSRSAELYPVPKINIESDENWDDMNVPSYNPKLHIESKPVLRKCQVASASQKREFRANEIRRHQMLKENNVEQPKQLQYKSLPNHRNVTHLKDDYNIDNVKEKLQKGANRSFTNN